MSNIQKAAQSCVSHAVCFTLHERGTTMPSHYDDQMQVNKPERHSPEHENIEVYSIQFAIVLHQRC